MNEGTVIVALIATGILAGTPGLAALLILYRSVIDRLNELEQARLLEAAVTGQLRLEVAELRRGVSILIAQVKRAGMTPEYSPPPATVDERGLMRRPALLEQDRIVNLWQEIDEHFDREEINDLVFRMGLPDVSRQETTGAMARALVMHAKRRGRVNELIELCHELRPNGGFLS